MFMVVAKVVYFSHFQGVAMMFALHARQLIIRISHDRRRCFDAVRAVVILKTMLITIILPIMNTYLFVFQFRQEKRLLFFVYIYCFFVAFVSFLADAEWVQLAILLYNSLQLSI